MLTLSASFYFYKSTRERNPKENVPYHKLTYTIYFVTLQKEKDCRLF